MDNSKPRPATGREIAREIIDNVPPWRWKWRGRYVASAQLVQLVLLAGTTLLVWLLAGTPGGAGWAAGTAFAGGALVAAIAEAEARVTERRGVTGAAAVMAEPLAGAGVPDGYVLAYELGSQAGQLGSDRRDPFLVVAAVPADRWDMVDALWRFSMRVSATQGVVVQLPAGSVAGAEAARVLLAEVAARKVVDLVGVERALVALEVRDLGNVYH